MAAEISWLPVPFEFWNTASSSLLIRLKRSLSLFMSVNRCIFSTNGWTGYSLRRFCLYAWGRVLICHSVHINRDNWLRRYLISMYIRALSGVFTWDIPLHAVRTWLGSVTATLFLPTSHAWQGLSIPPVHHYDRVSMAISLHDGCPLSASAWKYSEKVLLWHSFRWVLADPH